MAHPTLPFLKDKKSDPPRLALPAPKEGLSTPLVLPSHIRQIIKSPPPVDMTALWKPSAIQMMMREYMAIYPNARIPTAHDLAIWAYNRAKDAEAEIEILNQEIRILESGKHGI